MDISYSDLLIKDNLSMVLVWDMLLNTSIILQFRL